MRVITPSLRSGPGVVLQPRGARRGSGMPRRSRVLFALFAIVLVGVGIVLGGWQLDRASQKKALQAAIEAQAKQPPLGQAEFLALARPADALHRRVHLRGLWLAAQTVYLDNRQMNGKPGFDVLTPFALEGSNLTLMVQRGWIQRNFEHRTQLQPVRTPSGLVELAGEIAPPPAHLLDLSSASPAAGQAIRQNLDLVAFRDESGLPLRTDITLRQTGAASEGLLREWPAPALGIDRHYGYAFQWFALAALVALLFLWFQFVAPWLRARRRRRDPWHA